MLGIVMADVVCYSISNITHFAFRVFLSAWTCTEQHLVFICFVWHIKLLTVLFRPSNLAFCNHCASIHIAHKSICNLPSVFIAANSLIISAVLTRSFMPLMNFSFSFQKHSVALPLSLPIHTYDVSSHFLISLQYLMI